ncbi:hypothetical protein TYRP_014700 [Tyrophagus putrescentiae]|nr:hypothetical protein TYRP_014700 [Tyrophagus putrescentiae]
MGENPELVAPCKIPTPTLRGQWSGRLVEADGAKSWRQTEIAWPWKGPSPADLGHTNGLTSSGWTPLWIGTGQAVPG